MDLFRIVVPWETKPGIPGSEIGKDRVITYWQDGEMWLGCLDQFPDYMTPGTSFEDLKEHLLDLYTELSSGVIPTVRQHSELELA